MATYLKDSIRLLFVLCTSFLHAQGPLDCPEQLLSCRGVKTTAKFQLSQGIISSWGGGGGGGSHFILRLDL